MLTGRCCQHKTKQLQVLCVLSGLALISAVSSAMSSEDFADAVNEAHDTDRLLGTNSVPLSTAMSTADSHQPHFHVPKNALDILMWIGTVLYGLNAGLTFVFVVAVMPSLKQIDDTSAVTAMQEINRQIQNGWFFAIFFGGTLVALANLIIACASHSFSHMYTWHAVCSSITFFLGYFVVTLAGNVPLNKALDDKDVGDAATLRYWNDTYYPQWTIWNTTRTVLATLACIQAALFLNTPRDS